MIVKKYRIKICPLCKYFEDFVFENFRLLLIPPPSGHFVMITQTFRLWNDITTKIVTPLILITTHTVLLCITVVVIMSLYFPHALLLLKEKLVLTRYFIGYIQGRKNKHFQNFQGSRQTRLRIIFGQIYAT